jgi:hypothetical protein
MSPEERAVATLMELLLSNNTDIRGYGSAIAEAAGVYDHTWYEQVWEQVISKHGLLRQPVNPEVGWQLSDAGMEFVKNGGKS